MAVTESNQAEGEQVVAEDRQYLIHSWSVQSALNPIPVAGAEGRYFWDYNGKRYLDFAAQLVNSAIGHQHPKLVAAIKEQAERALHDRAERRERQALGARAGSSPRSMPGDLNRTFFTNGGAEANENAIKLARWVTGRDKVDRALPLLPRGDRGRGHAHRRPAALVRRAGRSPASCACSTRTPTAARPAIRTRARSARAAPHLEEILMYEGPHTVAAVILETVTGTNGIIVPPDGYLQSIREVCDRYGILLITDEVMAGWGRTGRWFAVDHWDVVPDIITTAKGINSGYVPLGAMTVRDHVYDGIKDRFFAGGLTYSGHPLACAVGVASIEDLPRGGDRRERRRDGRVPAPTSCRSSPSDTRRSARCAGSGCSGASSSSATARRASRSSRSTPAARRPSRWCGS